MSKSARRYHVAAEKAERLKKAIRERKMRKLRELESLPGKWWAVWRCPICQHDESTITAAPVTEHHCPVCAGEKEKVILKMEVAK